EVSDRRIKGVVHVAVDQAGQKSLPAAINDFDSLRHGPVCATGKHRADPLTFDEYVNVSQRRVRHAVNQPDSPEQVTHALPPPELASSPSVLTTTTSLVADRPSVARRLSPSPPDSACIEPASAAAPAGPAVTPLSFSNL